MNLNASWKTIFSVPTNPSCYAWTPTSHPAGLRRNGVLSLEEGVYLPAVVVGLSLARGRVRGPVRCRRFGTVGPDPARHRALVDYRADRAHLGAVAFRQG